jgi:hypothetical protein
MTLSPSPTLVRPYPVTRRAVGWAIFWAVCGVLLGVLLAFPRDFTPDVTQCIHPRLMGSYLPLCEDPWNAITPDFPQTRHRILAPVIAHYLGLRGFAAALLPWAANLPLLTVVYLGIYQRLGRKGAILATLLTATTLSVLTSATWPGFPDSLANLALVLSMFVPSVWAGGLCLFLGGFADERIFAVIPFVLLWHGLEDVDRVLRRTLLRLTVYGAAAILWFACTLVLLAHWGLDLDTIRRHAQDTADRHPGEAVRGLYAAFRACWLFPLLLLGRWAKTRSLLAPVLLLLFVPIVAAALSVGDISRVTSFALPAVLLGYVELYRHDARQGVALATAALVLNVISPIYQVHPPWIERLPSALDCGLDWLFGCQTPRW